MVPGSPLQPESPPGATVKMCPHPRLGDCGTWRHFCLDAGFLSPLSTVSGTWTSEPNEISLKAFFHRPENWGSRTGRRPPARPSSPLTPPLPAPSPLPEAACPGWQGRAAVQGGSLQGTGPAGLGQTPVTGAIYFSGTDQTATESFSLCHPSAGRLRQPPWLRRFVLTSPLCRRMGAPGAPARRRPQTGRRSQTQRSPTERVARCQRHLPPPRGAAEAGGGSTGACREQGCSRGSPAPATRGAAPADPAQDHPRLCIDEKALPAKGVGKLFL